MSRRTQLGRAIAQLEEEIRIREAAIAVLKSQQGKSRLFAPITSGALPDVDRVDGRPTKPERAK